MQRIVKALAVLLLVQVTLAKIPFLTHEGILAKKLAAVEYEGQEPEEQYFTQRLDHFNHQDTRTWQQRYFVNDTFWDPSNIYGGPVFVQIGGEGAISPRYVTTLQMANYAKEYGALMFAVEHRFYGKSAPLPDLSTENLVYLSSQQALADAAEFISAMIEEYGAQGSPIITFGCSYPGNLAAWFRLKYPTVTLASVASSAPVQATLDFYEYLDVVNNSISHFTGSSCDARIQEATDEIQTMLQTAEGKAQLQTLFNTCEAFEAPNDVPTFMANLMGNFQGTVQYNDEKGNPIDVNYVCRIITNSSNDALTAYIQVSNLFLQLGGASCLDISYANSVAQTKNVTQPADGVGDRSWTYQTCTQFGFFQTTDSDAQPFGDLVPLSYYTQFCSDVFGIDPNSISPNVDETNILYGGNEIPPYGPTNILFVNGNIDPWHALGVTQDISASLTAILIDGTAHCSNVYPDSPNDLESLIEARKEISAQIEAWLMGQQ